MQRVLTHLRVLLIVVNLLCIAPIGVQAMYTFTLIADETSVDEFPNVGGNTVTINNSGRVAFGLVNSTSPVRGGIFTSDGTSITPIYIAGTDPIECTVGTGGVGEPAINDAGFVAFGGTDTFMTTDTHLCIGNGTTTTVLFNLPGGPMPIPELSQILNSVLGFNKAGTVAFLGGLFGGIETILTINGLTGAIIATENEINESFAVPDINDNGLVTYTRIAASGSQELFVNDGSTETPLLDMSNGIEVIQGERFPPDINNAGLVAFKGRFPVALFTTNGTTITQVVKADGTSSNAVFIDVQHFALNNKGELAFTASVPESIAPPPPGVRFGHGLFTGPDPCADKVLTTGETLFGQEVTGITFFRGGHNDAGQLAFIANLGEPGTASARRVVVRAEPGEPDPACPNGTAAIDIEKTPESQEVVSGSDATFTITVTNTGDVDLSDVVVTDTLVPDCDNAIGDLAAGESVSYDCTASSVIDDFTNEATVVGTPVDGQPDVTDMDTADVEVVLRPVANAGENVTITSEQQCETVIQGTASDPDSDLLEYRWLEGGTEISTWAPVGSSGEANLDLCTVSLGLGQHTLTLEVSDGQATSSDDMILTIGNSAPHVAPIGGGTYQIGTTITIGGQVSDFDGDMLTYAWSDGTTDYCSGDVQGVAGGTPVALPNCDLAHLDLGTHTLTLTASDGINEPVSRDITIEVVDTDAPTLAPVPNVGILWPPNHKMVDIVIHANAEDNSGLPLTLSASVTSNEPQEGLGDGDQTPDWTSPVIDQVTGVITLQLRAERSGLGEGRIYTISITAIDDAGNSSTASVDIIVPHDQSKK